MRKIIFGLIIGVMLSTISSSYVGWGRSGLFTAAGKGTCTVTVQDALGNTATSGVITVQ